jgi:hypothetical protein
MNEKIKQMAEKAGFHLWEDEPWKPEGAVVDWSCDYDSELEKFAELIIWECCKICDTIGRESRKEWKTKYNPHDGGRSDGAWECEEQIKQHFKYERG